MVGSASSWGGCQFETHESVHLQVYRARLNSKHVFDTKYFNISRENWKHRIKCKKNKQEHLKEKKSAKVTSVGAFYDIK